MPPCHPGRTPDSIRGRAGTLDAAQPTSRTARQGRAGSRAPGLPVSWIGADTQICTAESVCVSRIEGPLPDLPGFVDAHRRPILDIWGGLGHSQRMNSSRQAGLKIIANTRRQVAVLFVIFLIALIVDGVGLIVGATWADPDYAMFFLAACGIALAIYMIGAFTKWLIEPRDAP